MVLNSRQFKFLKNYRNVNVKSSAKRAIRMCERSEQIFLFVFRTIFFDKIEFIKMFCSFER